MLLFYVPTSEYRLEFVHRISAVIQSALNHSKNYSKRVTEGEEE